MNLPAPDPQPPTATNQPQTNQPHYFENPQGESERRTLQVTLVGQDVEIVTADGVFSGGRLDLGTRVLFREAPATPPSGDLLDLGCGWGPIALTMAMASPLATVWAVDVNERALELTRENAARLQLPGVPGGHPQRGAGRGPVHRDLVEPADQGRQDRSCTRCSPAGCPGSPPAVRPISSSNGTSAPTRCTPG